MTTGLPSAAALANGSMTDLSGSIRVAAMPYCPDNPGAAAACQACSVSQVSLPAWCLPGTYDYEYSVSNNRRNVTTARRTVVIYQQGYVTLPLVLATGLPNASQVSCLLEMHVTMLWESNQRLHKILNIAGSKCITNCSNVTYNSIHLIPYRRMPWRSSC
jgi:hypothetical protein